MNASAAIGRPGGVSKWPALARIVASLCGLGFALTACGTVAPRHNASSGLACTSTVRGVVQGPGSITASWLPAHFRPSPQGASASPLPSVTYTGPGGPQAARLELATIHQAGPLVPADAAGRRTQPVSVQGHPGLFATGQPGPDLAAVYYKPSPGYLVSVVGYQLPTDVVLQAARHVRFVAPGIITLMTAPGRTVTRNAAIAAAERSAGSPGARAVAKLSSWSEISALMSAAGRPAGGIPAALSAAPWRSDWAVLLTGGTRRRPMVVVVSAATGRPEYAAALTGATAWFAALTDRSVFSRRAHQCQGGSSARIPFGVLTRDEAYAVAQPGRTAGPGPGSSGAAPGRGQPRSSVSLVLSTVPAVNRADSGLYGGCVQQNCSIDELVWVTITAVRAAPGRTVGCLPGSVSVPPGYRPKRVREYYSVSVPDNYGVGCGPVPAAYRRLRDLAPPSGSR
jgi:hypothetical protein